MESKKINQLATELAPDLSDLTIIGDPTTGISKKITLSQMASLFTGTVEEYANLASFPLVGVADTIYIALNTNIIYRWNTGTSAYVELSPNIVTSLVFNDANGFDGTISLVGSTATLTITTALTTGSVGFIGASGALLQDNANFFWDDTNNRLGLGTNAPTTALDVFGSGIIGRINGTSTNNAYLGFASAGTNKWSVGNVQSDHRFRIFSEANSAELISVLQTGEFGIGIANPTTKFHIDGAASALIANLDANVSVAKSVSFRSDNSARINLEVSGTESGSNAGADFFIRRYSDLGALIDTPLTITRSTGVVTLASALPISSGGTGSATQNFVDLTSIQTAAGAKTFSAITSISNATASTSTTTGALKVTGGVGIGGALFGTSASFGGALSVTGNNLFTLAATNVSARIGEYDAANRICLTANQNGANAQDDATKPSWGLVFNANATNTAFIGYKAAGGGSAALISLMTIAGTGGINIPVSLNNSNTGLDLTNSAGSGYGNAINFYQSTTKYGQILCETSVANTSEIYFKTMVASTVATRLFISSSGQIGIGTLSPSAKFMVLSDTNTSATNIARFAAQNNTLAVGIGYESIRQTETGGSLLFETNATERMRIQSDGSILAGTSNDGFFNGSVTGTGLFGPNGFIAASRGGGACAFLNRFTSTGDIVTLRYAGSNVGSISYNGSITQYNATSDYRLKENLQEYNGLEIVKKLNTYNFVWKQSGVKDYGMMAHELQEILPNYVNGEKDAIDENGNIIAQGVDYSKLVPILIKAIQEQQVQIDLLKAK